MIEPPDFHCLYTLYTNQSEILDMGISFFSVFFQKLNKKPPFTPQIIQHERLNISLYPQTREYTTLYFSTSRPDCFPAPLPERSIPVCRNSLSKTA